MPKMYASKAYWRKSSTLLSRLTIGETVFRLSVVPPDVPGFPKLVTLSERERVGGLRTLNFTRRFAGIATGLSSKTSTRPGNYQWWPVRPRGGLRQDSCAYFVYIELFFFRGLFACYWCAGPPWRP
jgi:hypothetical protein